MFRSPLTVMEVAAAGAVTTPLVQVVVAAGATTLIPAGSASVNDQPVLDDNSLVFVMVKVTCTGCPATWLEGLKVLSSWGVPSRIWRLSMAASLPNPLPSLLIIRTRSVVPVNPTDPDGV